MKRNQLIELDIKGVHFPAKGYGHYENMEVRIKGALPGQRVKARIKKKKTQYIEAVLVEVLKRASHEMPAVCSHFGRCGGCARQTLSYENQLELKEQQVKELFQDAHIDGFEWKGIVPSPHVYSYRNKMEYTFGDEEKGGPLTLGMHKKGRFHDVVTVSECKIVDEDFNTILKASLEYFVQRQIPKYDGARHTGGYLRHLNVRKGQNTQEILIGLSTTSFLEVDLTPYVNMLLALPLMGEIVGILQIVNDGVAQVVKGPYEILYGRDYYFEKLFDLKFRVSFYAFFQTNTKGAEALYKVAQDALPISSEAHLYDLFSGTGTIAQILARSVRKVTGIEIVDDAVKVAKENAAENGLENCYFLAGDVFEKLDAVSDAPDVIVVDPPRPGIQEKTLAKISAYGVRHMVYISCNPVTLVENLKQLQKSGYRVKTVQCVDLFPHTVHVETVALLSKLDVDKHISVEITMDELDLTSAESKATYKQIKEYIIKNTGLKVSSLNIAQTKRKYGIIERKNYNKAKNESSKVPACTKEKENAIVDALKYFQMV